MIRYYSSLQIGWRINFRTVFLVIRLEKGATFIYFYVFFFARFLVGFVRGFDLEVFCIFYRNVDGGEGRRLTHNVSMLCIKVLR